MPSPSQYQGQRLKTLFRSWPVCSVQSRTWRSTGCITLLLHNKETKRFHQHIEQAHYLPLTGPSVPPSNRRGIWDSDSLECPWLSQGGSGFWKGCIGPVLFDCSHSEIEHELRTTMSALMRLALSCPLLCSLRHGNFYTPTGRLCPQDCVSWKSLQSRLAVWFNDSHTVDVQCCTASTSAQ